MAPKPVVKLTVPADIAAPVGLPPELAGDDAVAPTGVKIQFTAFTGRGGSQLTCKVPSSGMAEGQFITGSPEGGGVGGGGGAPPDSTRIKETAGVSKRLDPAGSGDA